MRYSSVFNLGWILMAIAIDTKIFVWLRIIYWMSVVIIIYLLKNLKSNTLNTESKRNVTKWILLMIIANLAGIPPLARFLMKWILIISMVKISLIFAATVALIIRAINFFIYLRIIRKQVLINTNKIQIESKTIKKITKILILILNITPIILLIILGYAWNKGL